MKYNSANNPIWILQLSLQQKVKYSTLKKPSKQVTFKLKKASLWNACQRAAKAVNSVMEFFTVYFFF